MQTLNRKNYFYQWDMNMKITSDCFKVGDEIHFSRADFSSALVVHAFEQDGKIVANVPNIILQSPGLFTVYKYVFEKDSSYTVRSCVFDVRKRLKPDGYVYTETEVLTWKTLDERLRRLEESVTEEFIGEKVENYISKNSVGQIQADWSQTDETAVDYIKNKPAVLQGEKGEKGDAFTYEDFTAEQLEALKGADGYTPQKGVDYFDGEDGTDGTDGVGIESVTQTTTATTDGGENFVTVTLTNGNKSTFKVKNGSTGAKGEAGYTPVKGTDYFTEADKAEIVAEVLESGGGGSGSVEIPEALPNPNKLTFTGAVTAEYDGSEAVIVEIPGGSGTSGGSEYTLLSEFEVGTTNDTKAVIDLNSYDCNEFYLVCNAPKISGKEQFIVQLGGTSSGLATDTHQYDCDVFAYITKANGKSVGFVGCNHGWSGYTGHKTGALAPSPRSSEATLSQLSLSYYPVNAESTLVATCKLYGR